MRVSGCTIIVCREEISIQSAFSEKECVLIILGEYGWGLVVFYKAMYG